MSRRQFGQIARLPSKRYRARYADPRGALTPKGEAVRHSAPFTFTTKQDAEAWLADERRLIEAGTWTPPQTRQRHAREAEERRAGNLFDAYARAWLDSRHDLRPTTRASYDTAIRRHLVPAFGHLPLDEITAEKVRRWFTSYGDKTPTARAHAYQVLGGIMAQALDDELITKNPARIRAGGRTPVTREPEVLTLPELRALADAMPQKHRALTWLCGLAGLRFGEAVALRRRDVDLDAGTVTVTRTASNARGQKTTNAPKTAAGYRTVALPRTVVDELRRHLQDVGIEGGRNALVFPGVNGDLLAPTALYGRTARVERRKGRRYLKKGYGFYNAREAIGKPAMHWHDLRRTAATLGAQSGATVREMQHRLGHSTPDMALHYQSATAERDRAIADRLQAQLDALSAPGTLTQIRATE